MTEQKKPWQPEASFRFLGIDEEAQPDRKLVVSEHDGGRAVRFAIEYATVVTSEVILSWLQIDSLRELIGDRYGRGLLHRAEEP